MTRKILDASRIHPAIENEIGGNADFRRTVDEVENAINQHAIVIVGMDQNPFPKRRANCSTRRASPTTTLNTAAISRSGNGAAR